MQPNALFLLPGDPVPPFEGRTAGHPAFPFHAMAGRYVVLSFLGSLKMPMPDQVNQHILTRHRDWFDDRKASFLGISVDPADERGALLQDRMPGIRYIRDFDLAVSRLYGAAGTVGDSGGLSYRPMTIVLDPMMRVLAVIPVDPAAAHNAQLDAVIAGLPDIAAQPDQVAPVLVLPRVFEKDFCEQLIAKYEADGGRESGFMEEINGRTTEVFDRQRKRRRDYLIQQTELQDQIKARLGRRLLPAVAQVFQFQATRLERYLVACYEAGNGGFFTAHRDHMTRGTAHRRFAVTLNLNADYDGGDLVFPQFGPRAYRAPPGGAVVFSCALLHEARPVTRGRRFAFLPFLHDEAAEEVRLQNQQFFSGESVDRNLARADNGAKI